jgi:N-succinyldiaminopimelate aminotransferase
MAGATARYVTLRFPDFAFDEAALRAAVTPRTRLIVLNTPQNPTGKVFTREELEVISRVAREHDLVVLADEVYEHLVFDGAAHVPIATLPGMRERTLTLSSTGKTFSLTGWKVGWGCGPAHLVDAAQAAHQFVTYATATPLQVAMAFALKEFRGPWIEKFRVEYLERRDFLAGALRDAGFKVAMPRGTYFILADFSALHPGDDRAFARWLCTEHGVAAIPPSSFYSADLAEPGRLVRFAFCKRMETLKRAAERLRKIRA